jgi:phosphate-selective porin
MKLLRSIKSAQALSLAVASAATMMTANVAPSMAQAAPNVTVSFSNQGGHNTEYFVTGQIKSFDGRVLRNLSTFHSQNMLLGQKREASLPLTAQEIRQGAARFVTVTGRMSHNRQVFIQKAFRLDNNVCFFNSETVFNPKGSFRLGSC